MSYTIQPFSGAGVSVFYLREAHLFPDPSSGTYGTSLCNTVSFAHYWFVRLFTQKYHFMSFLSIL